MSDLLHPQPEHSQPDPIDPVLKGKLLPGVAAITLLLILLTSLNVIGALQNVFGTGAGKYGVLAIASILAAGLLGLLKMRRWGWAIVLAGCLLLSAGNAFFYKSSHTLYFLLRSAFMLLFFLYLVRPEVRDRMV